jgi:uncharacterized membrane protein
MHKALIFIHLVGFAAFVGAAFAQQQFVARSTAEGIAADVRDEYELLAAAIVTKIELPALFVQVGVGVCFLLMTPMWLTQGWMHAKLTCVVVLLVLSHLEMFNARKIVKARARADRGEPAETEIAARKKRHGLFGTIGTLAVVVLIAMVAYGTG